MRIHAFATTCLLLCGMGETAFAERYALLVGVSKYAIDGQRGIHLNLDGPAEDVTALKKALVEKQGFKAANVTALLNQDATRQGILDHLEQTIKGMKDGDYLLFFFGGHGTSAFDSHNQQIAPFIGPNSGALVPHDLRLDSIDSAVGSLIIGKRDLRPLLERLPPHSKALVLLDACYSENTVKSIPPRLKGKNRGITLGSLVNDNGARKPATTPPPAPVPLNNDPERAYPYPNVMALTAASKDEPAAEVNGSYQVNGHPFTVDGKAHGVFTNSLLKAFSGEADLNHDGKITLQELHDYTLQAVQANFPQTPQLLAPRDLINVPILSDEAATSAPPPVPAPAPASCQSARPAPAAKVRVFLENVQGDLRDRLAAAKDLELAEQNSDFVIRSNPAGYDLYDNTGSMVRQYTRNEVPDMLTRMRAEPSLRRFLDFSYPCQQFTASLRLLPEGQSRFSAKDVMRIEASLERQSYLVLFNIDKSGAVSIVYPATAEERRQKSPTDQLSLGSVQPTAPFGSEYLKLMAFPSEPPYDRFGCSQLPNGHLTCPDIQPASREFEALIAFIDQAGTAGAETRIRFTTYPE